MRVCALLECRVAAARAVPIVRVIRSFAYHLALIIINIPISVSVYHLDHIIYHLHQSYHHRIHFSFQSCYLSIAAAALQVIVASEAPEKKRVSCYQELLLLHKHRYKISLCAVDVAGVAGAVAAQWLRAVAAIWPSCALLLDQQHHLWLLLLHKERHRCIGPQCRWCRCALLYAAAPQLRKIRLSDCCLVACCCCCCAAALSLRCAIVKIRLHLSFSFVSLSFYIILHQQVYITVIISYLGYQTFISY